MYAVKMCVLFFNFAYYRVIDYSVIKIESNKMRTF
jgi:hypothetical protein